MTDGDVKVFRKRYSVTKKLGKGASGKTYLVEDLQESRAHKKVFKALKCIKLDEIQSLSQNDCEKEARLLSGLRHPYILRTYESFVEKNKFCLVAEYCEGGDLTHYLKGVKENGEHIDEKLVGKWLVQIILATSFIHKNKILHRDLKSSNIFLKNGNIKIGDFGISRLLTTTNELATTFIGTPYYMSPEVLKYEGYNNKSDIWSIGIILYELCTRRRAFTGTNLMRVMWQVINDPCPRLPEIYSKELQEVLQLMLKKVPQERPSASELLKLNIITSYLRELYKEIVFHMQTSPIDESILKKDEIQRFISFEEFINSPDLILQEQELQENDDNLSIKIDYNEENNTENVDDFLTPRQKIKLDRASESDQTIATLRDLAEQLTHSRNTLNSTRRTDLYTWQKRYPSSNRLWPTVQMSTEKMLNELKNLYLEKMNSDYGVTENMDDFENTENLLWPHRPLSENNDSLLGKGPGAEDESLGTFYLTESGKYTNNIQKKTEDSQNPASDSKLKNFCLVPGSTGPMYENRRYEQKKQVVITDDSVDNHDHKDEESNTNQLNLFIRRSFTIPEVSTNNYVQSARQLNTINSCKMKCDDVVSDNTQLMETYYTNYDNDLIEYSITSVHEDLSTPNETGNIAENDLEDIENQDDWNTNETLDDVLSCMKAALCQQEDDQTLVTNDETNCIYGLEAKAKKIETLRNYCVEKLGIQEFHTAYDYLYQKRITENNQSGELTILDGLKNYCSNVTTGFLLDHLIFLENDTKQTISVESPNSLYQILEMNGKAESEPTDNGQYPLVMIPGTAGSQAFAIFKNDPSRTPLPIWLNYNPTTGRTEDTEGVEVIFPGWGETWSIENLDETPNVFSEYFGSLVYVLKKDPYYVSNFTMRGAPYDFRKAPNENAQFFENLRVLIEETYENAKQRRVVLHPHSMGCLYALAFLKQRTISWKRKYIKSVIFSSCPFGGSVKSLKVEASGDNFGVFLRSPLSFRYVQRSMPSLTFMFPDARLWPASEPLIITPTKNYSTADYKSFFNDINYTVGYSMWKDTHSLVDGLEMPSGIDEIHCIHGSNLSTTDKIVYSPPNLFHNGFPDQVPLLVPGNGDGTVSIRSLEYCKYWPGTKYYVLPGAEHVHIMSDIRHINIVLKILGANITHG